MEIVKLLSPQIVDLKDLFTNLPEELKLIIVDRVGMCKSGHRSVPYTYVYKLHHWFLMRNKVKKLWNFYGHSTKYRSTTYDQWLQELAGEYWYHKFDDDNLHISEDDNEIIWSIECQLWWQIKKYGNEDREIGEPWRDIYKLLEEDGDLDLIDLFDDYV
jgi:hypothetical protein